MKVIGKTTVNVSSLDHKAPYDVLLLQDDSGKLLVKKADSNYELGDSFGKPKQENKPLVGVIGSGVMGSGIAVAFLLNGFSVKVNARDEAKALGAIKKKLLKQLGEEKTKQAISKLVVSSDLKKLMDCELIVESIIENQKEKQELFKQLTSFKGVLCTNTSSLNVTKLSEFVGKKENFAGMHFFNPADKMALVEVIKTKNTSSTTIEKIASVSKMLGKTPIIVNDSPGFVVNRLLMPFLNEAILAYSEGVASAEEIDSAIKLGLNHPMGPLKLLDLIGLDVFVSIMNSMHAQTKQEKFKPALLAEKMVSEGKLGIKSKQGFYSYK
ncbi:3-hydroxyacyl-CoA dehydrogenase family protein [Candidatus Micrarchaeota archaeon]|nr:3-hydroxyacyl-CoA dehydrogenase family protein [Candidatus Micrarchaeota archaeon]